MELLASDITPTASHYQLIHYDIPALDPDRHRVALCGAVDRPRSLSLAELKALPAESHAVLMACAGTGRAQQRYRLWTHVPWGPDSIGCAVWTGTPLAAVLAAAGPLPAAAQVVFSGADKGVEKGKVQYYERSMTLEEAMRGHVLLVYAMNGEALPPAHGAPVRLIVPGWYGCASVKWLTKIEVRTDQDPWVSARGRAERGRKTDTPNPVGTSDGKLLLQEDGRGPRRAAAAAPRARADGAAGHSRLRLAHAAGAPRDRPRQGQGLQRRAGNRPRGVLFGQRRELEGGPPRRHQERELRVGLLGVRVGGAARRRGRRHLLPRIRPGRAEVSCHFSRRTAIHAAGD